MPHLSSNASNKKSFQPKAVIFDFDGVLVDSLEVHLAAWITAAHRLYGRTLENPARFKNHAAHVIASIISREYGDPDSVSALVRIKTACLRETLDSLPLIAGAQECFFTAQSLGLKVGVATNSPRGFVEPALKALGFTPEALITSDEIAHGKPNPETYLACARLMDIDRSERRRTLVFEDSRHGLVAAVKAGLFPIGVETSLDHTALRQAGALMTCKTLKEPLAHGWLERVNL